MVFCGAHWSLLFKRHLDRFSRICTMHRRAERTDPRYVTSLAIGLNTVHAMQPDDNDDDDNDDDDKSAR